MWFDRHIEKSILSATIKQTCYVVDRARQTGKSSLFQRMFRDVQYITMDSIQYAEQAKENPDYFLGNFKKPVILDEVQYAPEIVSITLEPVNI